MDNGARFWQLVYRRYPPAGHPWQNNGQNTRCRSGEVVRAVVVIGKGCTGDHGRTMVIAGFDAPNISIHRYDRRRAPKASAKESDIRATNVIVGFARLSMKYGFDVLP